MDLENWSNAHHRCKAAVDTDTTTNVLFASGLRSIPQIFQSTIDLLEKEVKVKDTEFFVPGEWWVYMQFSPNIEYCSRAYYCHGVLPYTRRITSHVERDGFYPCANWNTGMKKYWWHSMSHKIVLITDYNDSIDSDNEPCELPTNEIIMGGCDDKSNIQVGNMIPLEDNPRKSNRAIVWYGTSVQGYNHDYGSVANILPSVIHNMNQYINPGD